MSHNLFAVVLNGGKEKGAKLIQDQYPKAYPLTENTFVISADTLSQEIASAVGLTEEKAHLGIRGVVFKLNGSYTGFTRSALWEWLEDAESGSA